MTDTAIHFRVSAKVILEHDQDEKVIEQEVKHLLKLCPTHEILDMYDGRDESWDTGDDEVSGFVWELLEEYVVPKIEAGEV